MKTHYTAAEYQTLIARGRPTQSKYGNKRTEYKGVIYDSKREAYRAWELDQMQKTGIIKGYKRQVAYELAAGIIYKADFVVEYPDGHKEIEDVKSEATRKDKVYRIKKRLMKEKGFEVKEV
jgi:hypothetical protein